MPVIDTPALTKLIATHTPSGESKRTTEDIADLAEEWHSVLSARGTKKAVLQALWNAATKLDAPSATVPELRRQLADALAEQGIETFAMSDWVSRDPTASSATGSGSGTSTGSLSLDSEASAHPGPATSSDAGAGLGSGSGSGSGASPDVSDSDDDEFETLRGELNQAKTGLDNARAALKSEKKTEIEKLRAEILRTKQAQGEAQARLARKRKAEDIPFPEAQAGSRAALPLAEELALVGAASLLGGTSVDLDRARARAMSLSKANATAARTKSAAEGLYVDIAAYADHELVPENSLVSTTEADKGTRSKRYKSPEAWTAAFAAYLQEVLNAGRTSDVAALLRHQARVMQLTSTEGVNWPEVEAYEAKIRATTPTLAALEDHWAKNFSQWAMARCSAAAPVRVRATRLARPGPAPAHADAGTRALARTARDADSRTAAPSADP